MKRNTFLQYLELERRLSSHTITAYSSDLDQFFQFIDKTYEITSAEEVTHFHIRSWVVELIQNKISTRSINRKLSTLKTYFKFLNKRGYSKNNPMRKVIAPKVGKRLPVFVNETNMELLFEKIKFENDFKGIRDRLVLELLYATGMRRAELIGLKISDINFEKNYLKVLGKGNKERLIPFGPHLKDLLSKYLVTRAETFSGKEVVALILTNKGQVPYPKFIYNLVKLFCNSHV